MSSQEQKFILVGPHAGKSMHINSHEFVDGEYVFYGSHEQIATLTRIFADYAALPAEMVELQALRAASAPDVTLASVQETKEILQAGGAASADQARELVSDNPAAIAVINLGEAIGKLDPESDADWTSNNLPSLERLAELVGKKVGRDEVNALADGYTRAKARTARGQ